MVERPDAAIALPDESSDEAELVGRPEAEEALPYKCSGENSEVEVEGVAKCRSLLIAHLRSA
jgi:hypothetical protein